MEDYAELTGLSLFSQLPRTQAEAVLWLIHSMSSQFITHHPTTKNHEPEQMSLRRVRTAVCLATTTSSCILLWTVCGSDAVPGFIKQ
jgi:hypothetical protein